MALAPALRHHVADLLAAVGPDAPTLCDGWTARDLAAHLVVRDRRPDAMPGIVIPAFAGHTAKVQNARAEESYATLINDVRTGPSVLNPARIPAVNERMNVMEFAVHAEDIRRAQSDEAAHELPPLPEGTDAALWKTLSTMGKVLVRSSRVGVSLRAVTRQAPNDTAHSGRVAQLKAPTSQGGITLVGSPTDLVMYLSGRQDAANVTIEGEPDAVALFKKAKLGL